MPDLATKSDLRRALFFQTIVVGMMLITAASVMVASASSVVAADDFTGLSLIKGCREDGQEANLCAVYLRGLSDGLFLADLSDPPRYCSFGAEQARLIVMQYLNEHPEILNERAQVAAALALRIACAKKTP
jgi:hypothetical protein